ncbi:bifunctional protein PutA [Bradyrhizobium sp. SSBR45G]|uniref:trifunctional transcriptional regulator/proline dehydrogenase/L-glutamate gamma-semialdehyde dehydrogenase n=1 Tax=unclassified Bradyrhizobium TaxID=2631580 RepID=UPI002342A404|nr:MULTISPECIES: trifunctional transcriptional regulator/proline dehydrogenase/L-glutamate gamma-semialdehyde dehydrogenase [unclassified Bradyrhizobium]GLH81279.1 bifunctional protein PutA [Bradyrhizobium sp. SSBR45G]GLH88701.1 bifunctional protein PutA [Bradyrhizobium sp. SSBR45R]
MPLAQILPDGQSGEGGPPIAPFAQFGASVQAQSGLRAAITSAYRRAEPECLWPLLDLAALAEAPSQRAAALARDLVLKLRSKTRSGGVEGLIHEYSLSSQEGVALMCLAEALLRIPDDATRDALIRDKIATGDWRAHIGHSPSLLVNAATWGLIVTGRLTAAASEDSLASAVTRLIARGGEPIIRKAVTLAMRLMGEQFVAGQTIAEALSNGQRWEAQGFRYSYDMLGEAAATADDAARYLAAYETAIHAIGRHSGGRGIYEGPGISIKLSALHPRYTRIKRDRVMGELLPRLKRLVLLARQYDIGLNIDAEEADRLDLSLDLLAALCFDSDLAGWNGIGFVIQAYQKRCAFVIDWIVDLARRSQRRLMVRLVKGAYWDSEIKRAQVDGLADFPVFTRKSHTDVSYLACARKLLAAPDAVFPQFATHNARTLASIVEMAGPNFYRGQYEFQCLHGMGEPLYEEVVGSAKLDRPCRIYAPVGSHETLLAYLVRRLLENGANTSFVNRIADPAVSVDELIADPVALVRASQHPGAPHDSIRNPRQLFGPGRLNSAGLDLSDEAELGELGEGLLASARIAWHALPSTASVQERPRLICNPSDLGDVVGAVQDAAPAEIEAALVRAVAAATGWASAGARQRAACLREAANVMEARRRVLIGLIVREAGKTVATAIAEVREAVDFLRYYAGEIERLEDTGPLSPLGPVVCISPWNFPLAIFTGQIAAALAAGNPVLAKPAEETPLIAAEAVRIITEAGVPADVLQLLPGDGRVGAVLVADHRVQGVMFTGSTAVARLIQTQLAERLSLQGEPVPLIAETGGQNALIVDSSALAEQVVGDVIASAFDSAGQRCSALRILCLQEEVADRILTMLRGAMQELELGNPAALSVDVGPVISAEAREGIQAHIASMRQRGHAVEALPLPALAARGSFVAPTIIEIDGIADVEREVFGPVLHVLRYRRERLAELIDDINASGYGLTFGVHSRIEETIARASRHISAGNVYVNRNIIGAVVGVQPFGGVGLSGTGPKAGGPLYLRRLLAAPPKVAGMAGRPDAMAQAYLAWLRAGGHDDAARLCEGHLARALAGVEIELAGPVGEQNLYRIRPRGAVAALAQTERALLDQLGVILATGNQALVALANPVRAGLDGVAALAGDRIRFVEDWRRVDDLAAVLFDGEGPALVALNQELAARPAAIIPVVSRGADGSYDIDRLVTEISLSTNTAAAGGNASLMAIG